MPSPSSEDCKIVSFPLRLLFIVSAIALGAPERAKQVVTAALAEDDRKEDEESDGQHADRRIDRDTNLQVLEVHQVHEIGFEDDVRG